ncbi:MAG: hypothetical protein JRG99_07985 [Deltaproteobacteria bacterium]|nr:hypothetical protein [Deltaproteobacteria bacterium]MBW1970714.1 hypothetical protein [Deltaproteobacteria bacterium]MBW2198641.1 hypothetical protein [Deltaproteobacteria bacterium]MBW2227234.1 hypothetical protein [Deltaproteobacteria bacterium]
MKMLNIVRSAPDDLEKRFIEAFAEGEENKVITLYEGDVDWSALVDDIFSYDKTICWW